MEKKLYKLVLPQLVLVIVAHNENEVLDLILSNEELHCFAFNTVGNILSIITEIECINSYEVNGKCGIILTYIG